MLTSRSKRKCLCREVPTDHEAHGQTQRWLQNSKSFGGTYAQRPKQYTRSTIEVMLKPFARARNDVEEQLRSKVTHIHARRVEEGACAVHENVTQGVMDSPQQHRRAQ